MHIATQAPPVAALESSPGETPRRRPWPGRVVHLVRTWRQRSRERGYLVNADHRVHGDLVASGQDVPRELDKPAWRR